MADAQRVTVFSFRVFEGNVECPRVMGFKATRAAISGRFDGELFESTAEDVPRDALDDNGCYRRQPTGWGALGPQ